MEAMLTKNNLEFVESAYYYRLSSDCSIDILNHIKRQCEDRHKRNIILSDGPEEIQISDDLKVNYYLVVRRIYTFPTFIKGAVDLKYRQTKFGYVLVIRYNNGLAILKKNISDIGIEKIIKCYCTPIPYDDLLLGHQKEGNDLSYKKMTMDGLNSTKYAIRKRTYESSDLKNNLSVGTMSQSAVSAIKYAETSINSEKESVYSINLRTAQVGHLRKKVGFEDICKWVVEVMKQYDHPNVKQTFLDSFARPLDDMQIKMDQITALVFQCGEILEEIQCGELEVVDIDHNVIDVELVTKILEGYYNCSNICNENDTCMLVGGIVLSDQNGIKIEWERIAKWILRRAEEQNQLEGEYNNESLLDKINREQLFSLYFKNNCVFHLGQMYDISKVRLSSIDLENVFKPLYFIKEDTTEKGVIKNLSEQNTKFESNTMFGMIEENYAELGCDYLILDDMSNEWADHIGIGNRMILFLNEKCDETKDASLSVSKFHVVVSQALKNIGNLLHVPADIQTRKTKWKKCYNANSKNNKTSIPRLRTKFEENKTIDDAIAYWKEQSEKYDCQRVMALVVNFMEINTLRKMVKENNYTDKERQLTWLINSFISSCREAGVIPRIYCREKKN